MNQVFDTPYSDTRIVMQTSLLSYLEMIPLLGERQRIVYGALKELCKNRRDATDSEIALHLGRGDPNYVRPRRNELAYKLGLIMLSSRRKCNVTGRLCMAWRIRE